MDELSLLEEVSNWELPAAETEVSRIPAPDFTGSLDYIDSLASRSSLSINRRDLAMIATAARSTFDYMPLSDKKAVPGPIERSFQFQSDMRPLQDARLFDPERSSRRPTGLLRASSEIVVNPKARIASPEKPYTPREIEEIIRSPGYRRATRHPFAFRRSSQTVICLKRRIRRSVIHALGIAGLTGFRQAKYNYNSRVACL